MVRHVAARRGIFLSILGISWFWLLGATFLAQFPAFAKNVMGGNDHVVTLFLTAFSIGIGIGSMLCNRLLKGVISVRYVPAAALAMTVFILDLYFATRHLAGRRRDAPRPVDLPRPSPGLACAHRPAAALHGQRLLCRAAQYPDPGAQRAQLPRPHHRRQQHPERALHGGGRDHRRRPDQARPQRAGDLPRLRHPQSAGGALQLPPAAGDGGQGALRRIPAPSLSRRAARDRELRRRRGAGGDRGQSRLLPGRRC